MLLNAVGVVSLHWFSKRSGGYHWWWNELTEGCYRDRVVLSLVQDGSQGTDHQTLPGCAGLAGQICCKHPSLASAGARVCQVDQPSLLVSNRAIATTLTATKAKAADSLSPCMGPVHDLVIQIWLSIHLRVSDTLGFSLECVWMETWFEWCFFAFYSNKHKHYNKTLARQLMLQMPNSTADMHIQILTSFALQ